MQSRSRGNQLYSALLPVSAAAAAEAGAEAVAAEGLVAVNTSDWYCVFLGKNVAEM